MQQNTSPTEAHYQTNDEFEISITDIAKALYAGRWFILLFAVFCIALALGVAKLTVQYKSTSFWYFEGLVKLPGEEAGISLSEYNRIMDSAKKIERFEGYLNVIKLEDAPEADLLRTLFTSREGIATQIKPFYSSLLETKGVKKDAPILGVSLEITAKSKALSHAALLLLSDYLTDTLAFDFYYDRLVDKRDHFQTLSAKNENALIELKLKRPILEQQQTIVENLIEKYARFFESSRRAETLIATEDTLSSSPIGRLMALELEISALDAQYERLSRQQAQTHFYLNFYQQALDLYQSAGSSNQFFNKLPTLLPSVFNVNNLEDEVVREAYNDLLIEADGARDFYQKSHRQLVKPSLPSVPTTRFALVAAASLLASLMLAAILVLMRSWWREVTAQNQSM